jgi:hypothetical protein
MEKKFKLTNEKILSLYEGFNRVGNLKNVRFAYAISKNKMVWYYCYTSIWKYKRRKNINCGKSILITFKSF